MTKYGDKTRAAGVVHDNAGLLAGDSGGEPPGILVSSNLQLLATSAAVEVDVAEVARREARRHLIVSRPTGRLSLGTHIGVLILKAGRPGDLCRVRRIAIVLLVPLSRYIAYTGPVDLVPIGQTFSTSLATI